MIALWVFVTKDEDPTGLLNEGMRYRDLETGAFITRDPLGFVDGPNMYSYVMANPWTFFDPQGLSRAGVGKRKNAPTHAQKMQFWGAVAYSMTVQPLAEAQAAGQVHAEAILNSTSPLEGASHGAAMLTEALTTAFETFGPGKGKNVKNLDNALDSVDAAADLNKVTDAGADAAKTADNVGDLNKADNAADTADVAGDTATATEKVPWNSSTRKKGWEAKGQPDGKAPQREVIVKNKKTGELETKVESKELHHVEPRHKGGTNDNDNLQDVWPTEHEKIDEYRHTGYEVIEEIPEAQFYDAN